MLFFSYDTPNLATVLPAMGLIDDFLTTTSDLSSKFCIVIHTTLTISKKTLDKYYKRTGELDVYCIAMGKFLFISIYIIYSDCNTSHIQSSTPVTSWSSSKKTTGMSCQSRKPTTWFKTNSTEHTGCWTLRGMIAYPKQTGISQ